MEGGVRTVIVTGPNTGGKTVALKTAGLLALMNQSGLALPVAEGTKLPLFDGVYADIGDEQSISQSLSTFSSHMVNMAGITSRAGERSLVLLDELGSGTDPEEGSAIAMALLDCLIEKKARLIVTTHHGILKNYGYTRPGVENASMEFNARTLAPTFRVVMGIPGESRAVDIASRVGLDPAIVARAREYLSEEQTDVSALIAGLKEKRRELDEEAERGENEQRRLKEERRKADLKELRLRQKELQLKQEGAGRLSRLLDESRKQLENLVRELKEGEGNVTREQTLGVKAFLSSLEASVNAERESLKAEEKALHASFAEGGETGKAPAPEGGYGPGREVLVGETGRRGRIVRQGKKSASGGRSWIVETGPIKINVAEKDLSPAPAAAAVKPDIAVPDLAPSAPAQGELNLIGMRTAEALDALDRQINAAVLSGLHNFAVVHGKGDGILQKAVHERLKHEKAVADYYFSRPEMGGFGRTEVVLR
jgi:DNA mismatch repair protein MutS2